MIQMEPAILAPSNIGQKFWHSLVDRLVEPQGRSYTTEALYSHIVLWEIFLVLNAEEWYCQKLLAHWYHLESCEYKYGQWTL